MEIGDETGLPAVPVRGVRDLQAMCADPGAGACTDRLRQTAVVALPIAQVSAKVSEGPPEDDPADIGTGVWAGVIPVTTGYGASVPAPDLEPGLDIPDYLTGYGRSR